MRNNVYVLSVKSFTDMGSAEVTIPTGGEDHDENFYLKLTSTILPIPVDLPELDISNYKMVDDFIRRQRPDVIINCAAYTLSLIHI